MASILEFERYKGDLNRQLLRRIGYTNGLHKIRRFARVVEYLYPIMPTSVAVLAQVIIEEENKRKEELGKGDRQLSGKKYATGIVDVAQALTLLDKFGMKIALSSQGYACHALNQLVGLEPALQAFLFERIIQSDGECVLNILRLVAEGTTRVADIGEALMERFLALIEFKREWVTATVEDHFAQRTLVALLDEARRTLERAIKPQAGANSKVSFFYKHTVNPRLEWLTDLGCLSENSGGPAMTEAGRRVLNELRTLGGWNEQCIFLPLDPWLTSELGLPSLYRVNADADLTWALTACVYSSKPMASTILSSFTTLLDRIKLIYPQVKIVNFNEADALSLYEVFAAEEASRGRVLSQVDFEKSLTDLVDEFPSEIFKLSKRRGRGLYIALKKTG